MNSKVTMRLFPMLDALYLYIYVFKQTNLLAMQSGKQHAGLYLSCQNNSLRNKALGNFPFKPPPILSPRSIIENLQCVTHCFVQLT